MRGNNIFFIYNNNNNNKWQRNVGQLGQAVRKYMILSHSQRYMLWVIAYEVYKSGNLCNQNV